MAIEINGLTKTYKNNNVVDGINLRIDSGEIFGLLGKNGAGKSTTIGMLTGCIIPTAGSFSILGTSSDNLDNIKKRIGVLPDTSNYYSDLSAIEHLNFFKSMKNSKETRNELLQILKLVGLEGHENKKIRKYSFGMKKKLGIAQSIIGKPDIIFLDEPTSGLDPESANEIQELIISLKRNRDKTIILTSHNLFEVEKICSRIAIMVDGKISREGTLKELSYQYFSGIQLEISTGFIDYEKKKIISQMLRGKFINVNISDYSLNLVIRDNNEVPQITRILVNEQVDIYRIEERQFNLEHIFFDTIEKQTPSF